MKTVQEIRDDIVEYDAGKPSELKVKKFLENKGFENIELLNERFAIGVDGVDLVICETKVFYDDEKFISNEKADRSEYEKAAIRALENNNYEDKRVRFDEVNIMVIDDKKALVRHHVNCWRV